MTEHMHIDKSISVGRLASVGMLFLVMVGGWVALNDRVTANSVRIEELSSRQDRRDAQLDAELQEISRSLARIEDRLTEKADRTNR